MHHTPAPDRVIFGFILVLISSMACSLGAGSTVTGGASPAAEASSQNHGAPPVQVEREVGPGDFFLEDRTVGLDALSSYTATLTRSFEGSQDGGERSWSHTSVLTRTQEPALRLMTFNGEGDIPEGDLTFAGELNSTRYEIGADGKCTSEQMPDASSLPFRVERLEPAVFLHEVFGAEAAGQDTLNNVPADHYTFDRRALLETGISEASGEFWMATEGGYLLKYILTLTGGADYFGEGTEGTLKLEYALTDIEATGPLELPVECRVNAPLLADAAEVVMRPGWVSYKTQTGISEAISFYQAQLPGLGWSATGDAFSDDLGAFLEYANGDQLLFVSIDASEGGRTTVDVILGSAGP